MVKRLLEPHLVELIGKRIGNYVIERPLAQGGMGDVFVAQDHTLGRMVAVKFIARAPECAADAERRFLDEARMTASLQHPNIITIFDYGELDGRLYYIMELLTGSDLASLMVNHHRFGIPEICDYITQISSGLHAAHAVGIVHRDLKPSNIFVLDELPVRLKLMDFGIAKVIATSSDHTFQGQIVGTPHYMSPEQALGSISEISPRSDIYALGIILFEMLTGQNVFSSESPMMLLAMHIANPPPNINDILPHIPKDVARLIASCLAKNPRHRPESAVEVSERFLEAVRGFPAGDLREVGTAAQLNVSASPAEKSSQPVDTQNSGDYVTLEPTPTPRPRKRASKWPPEEHVGESAKAEVTTPSPVDPAARTLRLSRADRLALNRLWQQIQEVNAFPPFLRERWDTEKRSEFEQNDAKAELAESILKDEHLSGQLMDIIGAAYADRFGSASSSIAHAILILGTDRVCAIALSISLYGPHGRVGLLATPSDSSISSLISGEIAQQFAPYASVSDAEQALMCGKFRNLGQHVAERFLPDLYTVYLQRTAAKNVDADTAAQEVFGITFRKLGLGVAERVGLPKPIVRSLSNVPGLSGRWAHEADRMVALAEFSNELCALIAIESEQTRPLALANLLLRHKTLLIIDPLSIGELLQSVQLSFERRYLSLLGGDATKGRFARNVSAMATSPGSRVRTTDSQMQLEVTRIMGEQGKA